MRVAALPIVFLIGVVGARADPNHYTAAQRYAGCLFGEAIPLMRRGMERENALSAASDRCVKWSSTLSATDIRRVDIEVHQAIEDSERQGL